MGLINLLTDQSKEGKHVEAFWFISVTCFLIEDMFVFLHSFTKSLKCRYNTHEKI